MKNQNRIIICGSPHSGKSVFVTNLYKILPQKYTTLIRACPDGEGIYSNNKEQKVIQLTRRKGKITQEFVEETKCRIKNTTSPIVLIDVGGLRSKENEEIFQECDMAIIVDKSEEDLIKWREFCQNQNLEILAELKSILNEKEKSNIISNKPIIRANILNLIRGTENSDDVVIKEVTNKIYELALKKGEEQKRKELLSQENVLNMRKVAHELDLMKNDNIEWKTEKAEEIYKYIKDFAQNKSEIKFFEARANWIVGLACDTAKKENVQNILLYDGRENDYITIPKMKKHEEKVKNHMGNVQKYNILKDQLSLYLKQDDANTIMQFELNPQNLLKKESIDQMILPNVETNRKMYISGRLPLWLLASITTSYDNTEKSILQPGKGYIQYASKDSQNLGKVENELPGMNLEFFLNVVKKGVSKENKGEER